MPEEKKCPFCDLDTLRNRILWECESVFVTLSNPNLMSGHTLVVPRAHVPRFSEMSDPDRINLIEIAWHFQEKIRRKFTDLWGMKAGCDLTQHDRSFLTYNGISVPDHLHIHLRPRSFFERYGESGVPQEELDKYKELLAGW